MPGSRDRYDSGMDNITRIERMLSVQFEFIRIQVTVEDVTGVAMIVIAMIAKTLEVEVPEKEDEIQVGLHKNRNVVKNPLTSVGRIVQGHQKVNYMMHITIRSKSEVISLFEILGPSTNYPRYHMPHDGHYQYPAMQTHGTMPYTHPTFPQPAYPVQGNMSLPPYDDSK